MEFSEEVLPAFPASWLRKGVGGGFYTLINQW